METKAGLILICFKFCWAAEESCHQLCRHSAKLKTGNLFKPVDIYTGI